MTTQTSTLPEAESVRSEIPQVKADFDYATAPPEKLKQVFRGLHAGTLADGRMLAQRYDFSSCRTLLDVGGGSGGPAIALAQALPHLSVTVVELPSVAFITQRFVDEAGVAERVQVLPADVVRGSLTGLYDAAVLRLFIQVLSAEDARLALQHIGSVVKAGGYIYIIGAVLDDSCLIPPETVAGNLALLNAYDGRQAYQV